MKLHDFDYELPPERIAQQPAEPREAARLLVHEVAPDRTRHLSVRDLPELLTPADLIVWNDTRVRRARLLGQRGGGGAVELLLVERIAGTRNQWLTLAQPAKRLRAGELLQLEGGALQARPLERERESDGSLAPYWRIELIDPTDSSADTEQLVERCGRIPLPPYIQRMQSEGRLERDLERYQTIFARQVGSAAAPTAGLHISAELLARLDRRGIPRAALTLHVGLGTFQPVQVEDVRTHHMHSERFELPESTVAAVRACRQRGGRVVAIGTTSCRVLESCCDAQGELHAGSGSTELFLCPGDPVRVVDVLLTNFHLPRSTLLMLVSAFAGRERVLRLYGEAIELDYRFYSYGDAMLLIAAPREARGAR